MQTQGIYPAIIEQASENEYVVRFPDIDFALTSGSTFIEAWTEASECLSEALAQLIKRGEPIPVPSTLKKGQHAIPPDSEIMIKVYLYQAMSGTKNSALAAHLGKNEKTVRRLVDPYHSSKLDKMEEALHALGKRLIVSVVDAEIPEH